MQSTRSLPSLPDPLRARVAVPDKVLSMGQIELNWVDIETEQFEIEMLWHLTGCETKRYAYTKLNFLKFNSALNDPKRIDAP